MVAVALATEDELSEAIGLRMLSELGGDIDVGLVLRRGGNGYLRSRFGSFCEIARRQPVLIITDLDRWTCPAALRSDWLSRTSQAERLLLRVAVREVESWLLADHDAMRALLGTSVAARFPVQPDTIDNPKEYLLALAAKAPREVRVDLRATTGAYARQGLGYNARLCALVREIWHPARASLLSDSLRRARVRLREIAAVMR
jgi:hypothetical protein